MGARSRLDKGMINYKLSNEKEVKFGPFNDMTVYNEFRAVPERANAGYTFDGEVIHYDFFFQRARTHYIQNVVVRLLCYVIVPLSFRLYCILVLLSTSAVLCMNDHF